MADVIKRINTFLEGDDNSEYFCYQEDHEDPKPTDSKLYLSINGRFNFTVSLPNMEFQSTDAAITKWAEKVNTFVGNEKDIVKTLKYATTAYADLGLGDEDDDDFGGDAYGEDGDAMFVPVPEQPRKSNEDYEQESEFQKFREGYEKRGLVTNTQAASRIFSDLRQLWKVGKEFGFSAEPFKDNLYKWNVKFFNFEKDTPLYKDMLEYKKRTGREALEFIMEFPGEYPFKPPFIRALRPRFAFHTGHITIGGSICMELLTNNGWSAANSVESILIQIRTEITLGGGRLDLSNPTEYTEGEARSAFARVARDHGWVS